MLNTAITVWLVLAVPFALLVAACAGMQDREPDESNQPEKNNVQS
jgi:hypothetical protein